MRWWWCPLCTRFACDTVGKSRTDSVPPTMQSQIPKARDVTLFFLDMTLYKWAAMHCLRRHPMCFYCIFINKTERSIHFYWIHFLNKIVTWLTREYVYLWYRLLEINVGTRDTAADEMLKKKMALKMDSLTKWNNCIPLVVY
jgi:hypothetical protein